MTDSSLPHSSVLLKINHRVGGENLKVAVSLLNFHQCPLWLPTCLSGFYQGGAHA